MNQENKEPEVVPGIAPDSDEVEQYRRGQETGTRDLPRQSRFNAWLLFVTIILVLLMGAGGYILYEVQENLNRTKELLVISRESDYQT